MAKKHRYRILPEASRDLDAIADYILEDDPARAVGFVDELTARFRVIAERPLSFPARPEFGPGLRSALYGNYVIIFLMGVIPLRQVGCRGRYSAWQRSKAPRFASFRPASRLRKAAWIT